MIGEGIEGVVIERRSSKWTKTLRNTKEETEREE